MAGSRTSGGMALRASVSLGAVATVALMHAQAPAQAATVGSVTATGATSPNSQRCDISFSAVLTGTVNDLAGDDRVRVGLGSNAGPIISLGAFSFVDTPVGQTLQSTGGLTLLDTNVLGPGEYNIYVQEWTSTGPGAFLTTEPLPRALLYNSGAACAALVSNSAPVAEAGPDQSITQTQNATSTNAALDSTGTFDPDGDAIGPTNWAQLSGPQASIGNAGQAITSVDLPVVTSPTTFVFEFAATDALGDTGTDTVSITVAPPNTAPLVDAGPDQTVAGGINVSLAGAASDADNDALITQWVQVAGSTVALSNANGLNPTFAAPARGIDDQLLTFELRADDGTVVSSDQVSITVAGNEAPIVAVSAQPSSTGGNAVVTLDGSGTTDPEGDAIIYQWTQLSGPAVTLDSPASAVTTFTAPQGGNGLTQNLTFQLRATDSFNESDTESVNVTLLPNGGPSVDAGSDQTVQGGSTVILDGGGSIDPDGDRISYTWTQSGGPTVSLSDPNSVTPTFVAPAATGSAQVLIFDLVVSDGLTNSRTDQVTVTIAANRPPVADAGVDQGPIDSGNMVALNGSGSGDPDGDTLTYAWTQVSGTTVTLSDPSAESPTFTAPVVAGDEDLVFQLIVNDGQTSSVADTVTISVRAVGSITIVQRVLGSDTTVAFTSDIAALNGNVTTSGGSGQIAAAGIAVGTYNLTAADLSSQGYALTDISCNDSDSSASIASRSVSLALSPNEDLICTFTLANTREAAGIAINQFLTGRNALILSHQPDLQRRLDRLNGAAPRSGSVTAFNLPVPGASALPLNLAVSEGRARASTSLSSVTSAVGESSRSTGLFDIWAELYHSRARIGSQEGNFSMAYVGADYRLDDAVLLGALVAFDDFSDRGSLEAGEAEGDGWMVGPYVTAKLGNDFFAEARAAWGSSNNSVSPLGNFTDSFDTNRSYYSGSLIGQFDLGDKIVLRPEVTVRYISEKQKAYVDSLNITVPSQKVDQGDVSFRPRISHLIELESGWDVRPYGEVEGIITFGDTTGGAFANFANAGPILDLGSVRVRTEAGLDFFAPSGFRASIAAFHDGIGSNNFRSSGVHIGISYGF